MKHVLKIATSISYPAPKLLWAIFLLVSLLVSILFFKLPSETLTLSVGSYSLSSFPSGLSLYPATGSITYYSISPLNDYIISKDGYRVALLAGESFNSPNFAKNNQSNKLIRIFQTIGSYFELITPSYVLNRADQVSYKTKQIDSDTVEVTKQIIFPQKYQAEITAITLSYNPEDFVYSPQTGSLFTQHTPNEIAWLKEITGINITQTTTPAEYENTRLFSWELDTNQVVIVNQQHSGYIIIEAAPDQTLLVNPKDNLIEVVESVPENAWKYTSSITIKIVGAAPH